MGVSFDVTEQKRLRKEVNHLADIVEESSEAIISRGRLKRLISWNKGAENLFGYSKSEAIGKTAQELGIIRFSPEEFEEMEQSITETGSWKSEKEYYHKNGNVFFGVVTANALKNDTGEITSIVYIIKDISLGKQLEEQLKRYNEELEEEVKVRTEEIIKNETQFRNTLNNMLEGIQIIDYDWRYVYANDALVRFSKYPREELIGSTMMERYPGIEKTALFGAMQRCMKDRLAQHFENEFVYPDGSKANFELSIQPVPEGVFVLSVDITERKIIESQLIEREELLELFIEHSPVSIAMFDRDMKYIAVSRRWVNDYRLAGQHLIGKSHYEIFPDIPQHWKEIHQKCLDRAIEIKDEDAYVHANGEITWLRWEIRPWRKYTGEIGGIIMFTEDVTERVRAEQALKSSYDEKRILAARMSIILNTLPANIALLDDKGNIMEVNDSWRTFADDNGFMGSNYSIGDNYLDISKKATGEGKEDGSKVARGIRAVLKNKIKEFVFEYPCHSPTAQRWFRMIVTPLQHKEYAGAVVMHIDISEVRRLEMERLNAKMDEQIKITQAMLIGQERERNHIGQELHDNINQILVGTKLYLNLAGAKNKTVKELVKYPTELINTSIDEIRVLCHKMVAPLKNRKLDESIRMLLHELHQNTGVVTQFAFDADANALPDDLQLNLYRIVQELVSNIMKYAEAKNVSISVKSDGQSIDVIVSDDGKGFDVKRKRVGIGISNMINRVRSFNGEIDIQSVPGKGCTTIMHIPY